VRARILAVAVLATACGSNTVTSNTAWAAGHPDPQGIHFTAAEGVCTITVRYPTDAPGEIDTGTGRYIQRDRTVAGPNRGSQLATSGDWILYQFDQHTLMLVTPDSAYIYKDGANCGSNSAPPT
jgi:hypothetical protein